MCITAGETLRAFSPVRNSHDGGREEGRGGNECFLTSRKMTDERFTKEEAESKIGTRVETRPTFLMFSPHTKGEVIAASDTVGLGGGTYRVSVQFGANKAPVWFGKEDYEKSLEEMITQTAPILER